MLRAAILIMFATSIAACDMFSTLTDGWKYAKAVEADLQASTGAKPEVGFNWRNGRLETVTVTFPRINETKTLPELAETVRRAVNSRFKQTPDDIVLAFSLGRSQSHATAQLGDMN
jgi:hypothetical protein